VSLGIGANDEFGGANKGSFFFASTLSRASVRSDRTSIVEGGKLRV